MKYLRKLKLGLWATVLSIIPATALSEESGYLTLAAGYESSSGKYGTTSTTDIVTIPVSAIYEAGPWSLKLTVPYLKITGDGTVISGGRYRGMRATSTTVTTATTTRTTQSGMGDVVTMLTYNLYSGEDDESGIDLSGRIKFGTADKTLGTGQNDYAAQLLVYHDFADFTPTILVGYEVLGSSPQLPLNNVFFGAVGGNYQFGELTSAGVEYKYAQKASVTLAEQRQAMFYANFQMNTEVFLRVYLLKGYAAGSPDNGYGLSVSSAF